MDEIILKERMREKRKELHMTQQELADECRISVDTIKSYETGRRIPKYKYLWRIAKIMGVDIKYFSE